MNWIVAVAALVAAVDLPQRVRQLREYTSSQRYTVAAGLVAVGVVVAAIASLLLDALDVSSPTMEVAAGMVLILWSLTAFFRWSDDAAPAARPGAVGGLVPGLFPIVFTPPVGVLTLAVAARNGYPAPILGLLIAAGVLAAPNAVAAAIGRRPARLASATAGVVLGIVMMTDGVLAV
ncbi:hypothetical protein [Desertimonas flava]|uniref:hypothetical protein n=1 Tax=Desertimonas flava TaxID=2064846 RepID=UPI000E34BDC3|nr:hypothetical protein [Desertimonas flava]